MDKLQMAKALLSETKYSNPGQTTTAYGVAVTDSQDGLVSVDMGGDTVSFDDEQAIECETTFKVYEGDEVIVSLIGADGSGKTPIIIGVVGRGDEQQTEIDGVKNYFWTNDRGAHISTIEQSVEGANMLLDADSLDIRIGGSNSEEDQTVLAKFSRDSAYISGVDGTRYWRVRDLRDYTTKTAIVEDVIYSEGSQDFETEFNCLEVLSVSVAGVYYDFSFDSASSTITIMEDGEPHYVNAGIEVVFRYVTNDSIFSYDDGIRDTQLKVGPFSKICGYLNGASGNYSVASGYKTKAAGFASSSEGYMTVANGQYQKAFGKANVVDDDNKYAEIVGGGLVVENSATYNFTTDGQTTSISIDRPAIGISNVAMTGTIDVLGDATVTSQKITLYKARVTIVFNSSLPYSVEIKLVIRNSYKLETYYINLPKNTTTITQDVNIAIDESQPYYYPAPVVLGLYMCVAYSSNNEQIFEPINDGDNVIGIELLNEAKYFAERYSGLDVGIVYTYGYLRRYNIYNLDWNGNAEFDGEVYLGGCASNNRTSYPAIRYNTENEQGEYYDDAFYDPKWIPINGIGSLASTVKSLYSGLLISDTTNKEFFLPQGSACLLITQEFNTSTNAYRGHRAVLLSVPKAMVYRSTAVQQVNLGVSTNSGVTITRPSYGAIQLKCSSATYSVNYQILLLTPGLQYPYKLPIIVNGLIMRKFDNTSYIDQIRSSRDLDEPCDCGRCNLDVTAPLPSSRWITRSMFLRKIDLTNYSTCHIELIGRTLKGTGADVKIGFLNNDVFEASQTITLDLIPAPYMIDIDVTTLEGEYYLAIDSINNTTLGAKVRCVDLFEVGLL